MWTLAWIFCYAIIHLIRVLQVPAYSTETNSFIVTIWYELLVFIFFCTFFVLWTIMDMYVELNIFFVHIQNNLKSSEHSVKNIDRILRYRIMEEDFDFVSYETTPKQSKQYFKTLCNLMSLKDGVLYTKSSIFHRDHLLTLTPADDCHFFH